MFLANKSQANSRLQFPSMGLIGTRKGDCGIQDTTRWKSGCRNLNQKFCVSLLERNWLIAIFFLLSLTSSKSLVSRSISIFVNFNFFYNSPMFYVIFLAGWGGGFLWDVAGSSHGINPFPYKFVSKRCKEQRFITYSILNSPNLYICPFLILVSHLWNELLEFCCTAHLKY